MRASVHSSGPSLAGWPPPQRGAEEFRSSANFMSEQVVVLGRLRVLAANEVGRKRKAPGIKRRGRPRTKKITGQEYQRTGPGLPNGQGPGSEAGGERFNPSRGPFLNKTRILES